MKFCTCPSRKLANALPVPVRPGRSLPWVVKRKLPAGDGGWITSSDSKRESSPNLSACRPRCIENTSTTCITPVVESENVLAGSLDWLPEQGVAAYRGR